MKKIFITLIIVLTINNIYCQVDNLSEKIIPNVIDTSPNAATLGAYGTIPVNLFNGLPNININLYNLKVNDFNLPISISYNASGIRPDERHGWVGLGWNLNVGGAITRVVKGGVDEVLISTSTNNTVASYYNNYSTLNVNNWASNTNMLNYLTYLTGNNNFNAIPAPDEFIFNVNGLSGSFFKNHTGEWVVKANQNIDIKITDELKYDFILKEWSAHAANRPQFALKRIIYGFVLTTDDGTQYVFGKNPKAIEFSANKDLVNDSYNPNFIVKTWYLTSIVLPNNKKISFQYKTNEVDTTADVTNSAVFRTRVSSYFLDYFVTGSGSTQSRKSQDLSMKSLEKMFIVYLDKIISEDTEITFNSSLSNDLDCDLTSTEWQQYIGYSYTHHFRPLYINSRHWYKLNNFVVKSTLNNSQIYRSTFNYLESLSSRLFLTSVDESGELGSITTKKHLFEYNPIALPEYNSKKLDHWGFYNNVDYFATNSPADGSYYSYNQLKNDYYISRNPNPSVMQAGMLTKIIYPTGGFSQFEYEPHDFSKVLEKTNAGFNLANANTTNEIAGGLRIKKIISSPLSQSDPSLIKEYFYVRDYKNSITTSSGILSGRPVYIEEGVDSQVNYFKFNSNILVPLNDTNGNHVTYSNVVEKNQDGSFTEYNYSNQDNGSIDQSSNNYLISSNSSGLLNTVIKKMAFNSFEVERGKLISEKKYNSQKILVSSNNNYYNNSADRLNDNIRSLDFTRTVIGAPYIDGTFYPTIIINKIAAFTIYSHHTYLSKSENIVYDLTNNSSTTTTNDFTYSNQANHHHLKSKISSTSFGTNLKTTYFYPMDTEMSSEPFRNELINKYMVGISLDNQQFRGLTKISEKKTQFGLFTSAIPTNPILLPNFVFSKKGEDTNSILEKKITYNQYDDKGNILQYTPENGVPTAIIWGYNKTQPIAKLENCVFSSIPTSTITLLQSKSDLDNDNCRNIPCIGNEMLLRNELNNLRNTFPNSMITTYTYDPLIGVTSITDPKGNTITYHYDSFGRLQKVTDKNGNILTENEYNYKP